MSNSKIFPAVIGHRGAASLAPENTLAGLSAAAGAGCRAVEFDVKLTRDDAMVLFHDDTLERTTDGHGPVADHTAAEIAGLDAGSWFGPGFAGEPVPALSAAVSLLGELRLAANVELKPGPDDATETGTMIAAWLAAHWPQELGLVVSSFSETALAASQAEAPKLSHALLVGEIPADWQQRMDRLGCTALHAWDKKLDRSAAHAVIDAGVPLRIYTVNDPVRARTLWDWGVQSVFTDVPQDLLG